MCVSLFNSDYIQIITKDQNSKLKRKGRKKKRREKPYCPVSVRGIVKMANNGNLVSLLFLGDALPIDEDFLEEIAKDFKSDCSMAFTRRKVEEEVRKEDESEDKEASTNTNETELPNRPPFERVLQKLKHMIDAEKSDESSHSESVDHIDKQEGTEIDVQDNTQGETKEDKVHKILLLCFAETPDELIKLKKETPLLTVVLLTPKAQKKRRPSITSLKISKDTSASSLFHSSLITSVRKWVIEGKMFRDVGQPLSSPLLSLIFFPFLPSLGGGIN